MNGRFTIVEDEMLIELVKNNPLVYNVTSKTYVNIQNRNQIWREIAKQLNRSEFECKIRWKSMRDYYLRRSRTSPNSLSNTRFGKLEFLSKVKSSTPPKSEPSSFQEQDAFEETDLYTVTRAETLTGDPLEIEDSQPSYVNEADEDFQQILKRVDKGCSDIERAGQMVSSSRGSDDMAVSLFFQSISATVSDFPRNLQIEAKMKIMQVIGELELKMTQNF